MGGGASFEIIVIRKRNPASPKHTIVGAGIMDDLFSFAHVVFSVAGFWVECVDGIVSNLCQTWSQIGLKSDQKAVLERSWGGRWELLGCPWEL